MIRGWFITRIDIVPVQELCQSHITSGIHEILRVFGLVRKAQASGINKYNFHAKKKPPTAYTLGTGHVLHFYNKLSWVADRYAALCAEHRRRGGNVNEISREELLDGIADWWQNDYTPTEEALAINRERIAERVSQFKRKEK